MDINNRFFTIETEARKQFYQIPKQFMLKQSKYFPMSSDAKMLYGILTDRNSLSIQNGWVDENDRVYFIATIDTLMDITGWGNQKVTKHLKELRTYELLYSKVRGQGKPSHHYLLQIELEEGLETLDYQKKCDFHISKNVKTTFQEMLKSHANNTNINNTELNNNLSVSQSAEQEPNKKMTDRQTDVVEPESKNLNEIDNQIVALPNQQPTNLKKELEDVEYLLANQVHIDQLKDNYNPELVDEIALNIMEMYLQDHTSIKNEQKPKVLIQGVLSKLTYWHLEAVILKFTTLGKRVKNNKAYLQAMIYNAPFETQANISNNIGCY